MSDLASRIAAKANEMSKQKRAKLKALPDGAKPQTVLQDQAPAATTQPTTPIMEPKPTYRDGKRNISAYHPDAVFRQFKILAAETDKTVQELHCEALNLLFKEYEKPPIA